MKGSSAPAASYGASPARPAGARAMEPFRVDPRAYAAIVALRYEDPEEHLRDNLRRLGYSDRLVNVGPAAAGDALARARCAAASPAMTAYLGHRARAAGARPSLIRASTSMSPGVAATASASPPVALYFPQRLLAACAVSLLACAFAFMYALALTDALARAVSDAWTAAQGLQALAAAAVTQQLAASQASYTAQVQTAMSWAAASASTTASQASLLAAGGATATAAVAQALQGGTLSSTAAAGAQGAPASDAAIAALSDAVAAASGGLPASQMTSQLQQQLAASQAQLAQLGLAGGPGDWTSALQQSGLDAVNFQVQQVLGGLVSSAGLPALAPIKDDFLAQLYPASVAGACLALLAIVVCWTVIFAAYRARMLAARRGSFPDMVWSNNSVGAASAYIGIQVAQCVLSFAFLWFVCAIVILSLSVDVTRQAIANLLVQTLLAVLGVGLVLQITQMLLLHYVLTWGDRILYRRLYMLADLWFSLAGLFVGFIIGVLRLVWSLVMFVLAFARCDVSALPLAHQQRDPATGAFNAMFMQDAQFSNPLKLAFVFTLLEGLLRRRHENRRRRDTSHSAVSPMRGSGALDNSASASQTDRLGFLPSTLDRIRRAATGGSWQSRGDSALHEAEAAASRRRRVRNRLLLAVTLHNNPRLRTDRVHEMVEEESSIIAAHLQHILGSAVQDTR